MRIFLVAKEDILRFDVPMDVPSFMELFQPKQALISNAFHIDDVEGVFFNDVL